MNCFMWNSERNKPSPSCFWLWRFIISMINLTKTVLLNPNAMVSNLTFLPFGFRYCSVLIKHSKGNKFENLSVRKKRWSDYKALCNYRQKLSQTISSIVKRKDWSILGAIPTKKAMCIRKGSNKSRNVIKSTNEGTPQQHNRWI